MLGWYRMSNPLKAAKSLPGTPLFLPKEQAQISARLIWAATRFWMETENLKSKRYGGKSHHHWYALLYAMKAFQWLLKLVGGYETGQRNAARLARRELELRFPRLPEAFDGFSILHLSDLHLDGMDGLDDAILALLDRREVDLCVLTGDYRTELHGPIRTVMERLRKIVGGIRTRHGILGVLGNHDDVHMVAPMEDMGIRMLINESVQLQRDGQRLQIIGTDDVHYYYTDQALHALEAARDAFSIALVHSPELYDAAAEMGVALYLCGHTHGGQVCLPGGIPIIKHLNRGRALYRGTWSHRGMLGVTNVGAGTSGIPVRFNTQGEILILTLRRGDASA
jgi:predicted MPP superfamily phosphohydrolase